MGPFKRVKSIWKCRKELWLDLKIKIDFISFQKEWRAKNEHNGTVAGCKFDINKVQVGNGTYGTLNIHGWDNPQERIDIGSFCSIAEDVNFILGGMHPINRITTYPYKQHIYGYNDTPPTGTKGPIVVEDDVWICYGVTVLSGVTIGKGSVIGAKSVITKDIPPYSIVINGEVKKQRFNDNIVRKIKDIDLIKLQNLEDKEVIDLLFETDINDENVDYIVSKIEKL